MAIQVPAELEAALRDLAKRRGESLDQAVERALRNYIVAESITDITPLDLSASPLAMIPELELPPYEDDTDRGQSPQYDGH